MADLQKYLDSALSVVERLGIVHQDDENSQLANLLTNVQDVDEGKVLAIAKTVNYMGTFNRMVRDNVEDMNISTRYQTITEGFNSIRDDHKALVHQLDDGKIDLGERTTNLWMKMVRGTPHARFEKISETYRAVSKDVAEQLEREDSIMGAYMDFRFALKNSVVLAHEVKNKQEISLGTAKDAFNAASKQIEEYRGSDEAERSRLELARDEAKRAFDDQDKKYQLIKDVAEDMSNGYHAGEVLVAKLKQTHDLKEQVYKRAISFFTTNEHVFTVMDAVYTSQQGLHEATQTVEALADGANKGLEDLADLGHKFEKAAIKAGYGAKISPQSVQKLVDAIVTYQTEQAQLVGQYRAESTAATKEIGQIVENGKQQVAKIINSYITAPEPKMIGN